MPHHISKDGAPGEKKNAVGSCPNCKGAVTSRAGNEAYPFCSVRCRAIDLAKWFGDEYRVPGKAAPPPDSPDSGDDQ
jgi:endogenous inhibitor of DNA gyrase (YacG/DUF329 family)